MSISTNIQVGVLPIEARFIPDSRELEIEFNNGSKYRWLVDALEMKQRTNQGWQLVPKPTDQQLDNVEIWNNGEVIEFTDIEQCFSIPGLMRGQLGSKKWMQELLSNRLQSIPTIR